MNYDTHFASDLQKFKSQVRHLNKITASDASSSTSLSRERDQLQHLPTPKHHSITDILCQPSFSSNLTVPQAQDVNCHLRLMMNHNNSISYNTTHPNHHHPPPKTYGGFEATNLVDDNCIFTDELYENESSDGFVQTSHFNFQYFGADHDYYYPFLSAEADNNAVQELEFAQNLAGCLDFDSSTSGALSSVTTAGSLNQNVALKELDDLLNNTEEDPMVYCRYDGEMDSFDIDQYSEWLSA